MSLEEGGTPNPYRPTNPSPYAPAVGVPQPDGAPQPAASPLAPPVVPPSGYGRSGSAPYSPYPGAVASQSGATPAAVPPAQPGLMDQLTAPAAESPPAYDSLGRDVAQTRYVKAGLAGKWVVLLLLLALALGAAAGALAMDRWGRSSIVGATGSITGGTVVERAPDSVASIAARVAPSVVSIEVQAGADEVSGSGFVFSTDGYIVTNNHVVSEAGKDGTIVVVFPDGKHSNAKLIGATADYDLAVIKVDRGGMKPLALADSTKVKVGDTVVAVGSPLGLTGTVTSGIISALNRPVKAGDASESAFINAIQTDAAINPGNSGGPLVNAAGEVIGVNSAIAQLPNGSAQTGSIGLGFAIPSNQVKRTATQLIKQGFATYPIIGVQLDSRYSGEGVKVATQATAGVVPVTPGGPADKAGIKSGDIITAIDGQVVSDANSAIVIIRAHAPGDKLVLTVRGNAGKGAARQVTVTLGESSASQG